MLLELLISSIIASTTPTVTTESREAIVTAYSAVELGCEATNCLMSNGIRATPGYAACPRSISLGTWIRIDGVIFICGDRTATRFDGRFDLFTGYSLAAYQGALQWGIRTRTVEVLAKAPAPEPELAEMAGMFCPYLFYEYDRYYAIGWIDGMYTWGGSSRVL